jgi:carbamoyl-phosphate synthase small subunit
MEKRKALLVLEDGLVFEGHGFGASGETVGEVVFHTGMTGYQEILTDPSYHGQLVAMTYPHIGNTGVNPEDVESWQPQVAGFIAKEVCRQPSSWRQTSGLPEYLQRHGIIGIEGIDTRALTRHLRDHGAKMGIISTESEEVETLLAKVRSHPNLIGRDLVQFVTCGEPYPWNEPLPDRWYASYRLPTLSERREQPYHVVAIDCGIKRNTLRWLVSMGCRLTVVPVTTSAEEILSLEPKGVLVSNGPGDPEPLEHVVATLRGLLGRLPLFGICLGHQLLALALGGRTYKLKFGHHGANHPVKHMDTGRVEITSQNHGFAVDPESLDDREVEITHINLNDHTVEGLRHRELPVFAVQYHPEASPGPHDSGYLFGRFIESMDRFSH